VVLLQQYINFAALSPTMSPKKYVCYNNIIIFCSGKVSGDVSDEVGFAARA
jgi:hypothetical protein